MAVDKNLKKLGDMILKAKGVDPDAWLTEQYQNMINQNTQLLTESLSLTLGLEKK